MKDLDFINQTIFAIEYEILTEVTTIFLVEVDINIGEILNKILIHHDKHPIIGGRLLEVDFIL
jgi:hypothetical protein